MTATGVKHFESEIEELNVFLEDKKEFLDHEVSQILETCLEMMERFPKPVNKFDIAELHDFMAEKAEKFYQQFKDKNKGINGVTVEKNIVYLYDYASISLIRGQITLLYPFMLLGAANYLNFIPLLCRNLRKLDPPVSLSVFFDGFYELYIRGKPRLYKRDIEFLRDISGQSFESLDIYNEITRKFEKAKRYNRLKHLRVLSLYHTVNFPVLGLIPYIHLADHQVKVPEYLKPFIEKESRPSKIQRGFQVFRLFLLPSQHEQEWASNLAELGLTGKLEEWYRFYNWNSLVRTRRGTWKWKLDFSELKPVLKADSHRNELYIKIKKLEKASQGLVSFLDAVHRLDIVTPEHIAPMTGTAVQTVYKYLKHSMTEKAVLPAWRISRIGLEAYFQVIFENKQINQRLVGFLDTFPKVTVMKSKAFYRYLLFLPFVSITRLNSFLKSGEEQGDLEILSRREITLDAQSIIKGVNLSEVWKKLSDN